MLKRTGMIVLLCGAAPAEDHLKFGQPACRGQLLDKSFFVVCHSASNKIPIWVGYVLTKEDVEQNIAPRKDSFRPDPELAAGERSELRDYKASGFARGHMAPANDFKRSVEAMRTTFLLSNMCPQKQGLNGGQWARLEGAAHALAGSHGVVWIFTGPAFASGAPTRTIGPDEVAVPTHFFKVLLCVHADGSKEMFAYVMPNLDKPEGNFRAFNNTVSFVQELTGLDFFAALPDEEEQGLESSAGQIP
jgi:endonuclease G